VITRSIVALSPQATTLAANWALSHSSFSDPWAQDRYPASACPTSLYLPLHHALMRRSAATSTNAVAKWRQRFLGRHVERDAAVIVTDTKQRWGNFTRVASDG